MLTRRKLLQDSGLAIGAGILPPITMELLTAQAISTKPVYLNLNENAFGPSPRALEAIRQSLGSVSRYADATSASAFKEQIAAREQVPVEQIVLGEVLDALGMHFAAAGGPGGEFLYSSPGYLALVDAASRLGGVEVPIPLNAQQENDLPALANRVNSKTRAIYLVNPHNPTGTVSDDAAFKRFLTKVSQRVPVIVDEAYLEYLPDAEERSAVALVRQGADVIVFRTFDKIHGLAGLPMGYAVVPKGLGATLRQEGAEDLEALGRLNIAAASAALQDKQHPLSIRKTVDLERAQWHEVLDELKLVHTDARASFVFFDAKRSHDEVAEALRLRGVLVGRTFQPYATWVRITIGLSGENRLAQTELQKIIAG